MNQMTTIKNHLESGRTITSIEAFQLYGITRLSDKIFKLKQRGMDIDSIPTSGVNRYGDDVRFSTYRLSTVAEKLKENK